MDTIVGDLTLNALRAALNSISIEDEVENYEFRADEGDHTPDENETSLLIDFGHGLIGKVEEALRPLVSPAPAAPVDEIGALVERICHEEQMQIWSHEIAVRLSMGDYLRNGLTYEDKIHIHREVEVEIRSIVESVVGNPEVRPRQITRAGLAPEIIRHRKGGEYEVLARGAQIQTDTPLTDYAKVDVYRSTKDGATWVRPVDEMHDGRFEVVAAAIAATPAGIRVSCHRCSGTGWATWEDRHTKTNRDRCTACGGTGWEPAATGERREASFDPATGRCFGEGEGPDATR